MLDIAVTLTTHVATIAEATGRCTRMEALPGLARFLETCCSEGTRFEHYLVLHRHRAIEVLHDLHVVLVNPYDTIHKQDYHDL